MASSGAGVAASVRYDADFISLCTYPNVVKSGSNYLGLGVYLSTDPDDSKGMGDDLSKLSKNSKEYDHKQLFDENKLIDVTRRGRDDEWVHLVGKMFVGTDIQMSIYFYPRKGLYLASSLKNAAIATG